MQTSPGTGNILRVLMRLALRKAVFILGLSLMLNLIMDLVNSPRAVAAYTLSDAGETVGIATGIGAVIGFSTIAFYEQPFSHMTNVLVGAGAGMLVGLGVAAYMTASDDEADISPEELLPPVKKPSDLKQLEKNPKNPIQNGYYKSRKRMYTPEAPRSIRLGAQAHDLGSMAYAQRGWSVAARVVELRF
ncbi:MAG TPA: hypothetical protein PLH57_03165 [Oligoflexia bacterium]|nr:hypothetical protein [Oligoflexia bacterium]